MDSDSDAGMWQIFRMALANIMGPLVAHPSGSKSLSVDAKRMLFDAVFLSYCDIWSGQDAVGVNHRGPKYMKIIGHFL